MSKQQAAHVPLQSIRRRPTACAGMQDMRVTYSLSMSGTPQDCQASHLLTWLLAWTLTMIACTHRDVMEALQHPLGCLA